MDKFASLFGKKVYIHIIFSLVMFLSFSSPSSSTNFLHTIESTSNYPSPISQTYIPHSSILILSDQNFTDYGFPGTGEPEDPYRIENYFINVTGDEPAIAIYATTKRVIIQNCYLTAKEEGMYARGIGIYMENTTSYPIIRNNFCVDCDSWGIRLVEVGFPTITNNTCINNSEDGISIWGSVSPIITNNTCTKNEGGGISVIGANEVVIENNTCEENELSGIYFGSVYFQSCSRNKCVKNKMNGIIFALSYGTITENYCAENSLSGMRIAGSSYSVVVNNTCIDNTNGIYIIESFHLQVLNNTCENNNYGIYLVQGAWYDTLANNTIMNSTYDGIFAMRTRECAIIHNRIENSKGYGIFLEERANDTLIAYNSFINNNPTGLSQGYDDGFRNIWYDKVAKKGNHWTDYSGKGHYPLTGRAESVDKYPLDKQLERVNKFNPYWGFMSLLILPIVVVPLIIICRKKLQ